MRLLVFITVLTLSTLTSACNARYNEIWKGQPPAKEKTSGAL
jgi:hypothetical protein